MFISTAAEIGFWNAWIFMSVFIWQMIIITFTTYRFITTPSNQLIQKGVYRISRHPMYLATFLICLGAALASASSIFILLSLILVLCLHYEALVEERYCIDTYKESYAEYMKRVPRWFGLPKN